MIPRIPGKWWDIGMDLVTGCTPVSPACENCWSAAAAHRKGGGGPGVYGNLNPKIQARYGGLTDAQGRFTGEVRPQWQDLDRIGAARKPQVYTFWTDLFHPAISFDLSDLSPAGESLIDEVIIKILTRPKHFYIICTKRPERALEYFLSRRYDIVDWPGAQKILSRRLMLMTTVENQEWADRRIPDLLKTSGVLHGVSYEPALGPVDFAPYGHWGLDWLIAGGETGSYARPSHPDWFRQARDQCQAAGVPFFFKSWGEWTNTSPMPGGNLGNDMRRGVVKIVKSVGENDGLFRKGDVLMRRVGKKTAGRVLDGQEWNEMPHGL